MEELLTFIKEHGNQQLYDNLLLVLKMNSGKLSKFKFSQKNYKLYYNGELENKELLFKHEVIKYLDKYGKTLCQDFFNFWSQPTKDLKKMRWELEKTWDTGKRMATWFSNQQRRGY